MVTRLILVFVAMVVLLFLVGKRFSFKWIIPKQNFSKKWRQLLEKNVGFYAKLEPAQKKLFEYKVQEFLANCNVTGYGTDLSDLDRLLVASSAVIPIFAFPEWKYKNLKEVLVYESNFNLDFETKGRDRNILGMVGEGIMDGKMILSREAIRQGFKNERDKRNTAIHEFIHLIDGADGTMDGIPRVLMEKQYVLPWVNLIEKKLKLLMKKRIDIRPYGGTNATELFAVLGEYFFERPYLLKKKHPELYSMLEEVFDQDPDAEKLV
jgi:Mlc titration factor MtfA (ptsG expression regulator)